MELFLITFFIDFFLSRQSGQNPWTNLTHHGFGSS